MALHREKVHKAKLDGAEDPADRSGSQDARRNEKAVEEARTVYWLSSGKVP